VYLDARHGAAERAADLVSRMTLEEKAAQLATTNAPAIPRLGVQEYAYWSEALHGVNAFWGGDATSGAGVDINNVKATSFPSSLSASLTWDPALLRRVTTAISDEARGFLDPSLFGKAQNNLGPEPGRYGSLFYFAPTVNLDRDPRWGRVDESYGEDPLLTAALGAAYVQGFQGETSSGRLLGRYLKAVTTLKHYALNNVENDRMGISSDTDEGTIRDYYTRQFRDIIRDGRAAGVMSSYNSINGVPAVANNFTLNVLLRRTFGFRGYVTSDCGAVGTQYRADNPAAKDPSNPGSAALLTSGHDWAPPGWSSDHGDQSARWTKEGTSSSVSGRAGAEAWSLRAGTGLNCVGANGLVGHPVFWDPLRPLFSDENRIDYVKEAIAAGILGEDAIDRELVQVFTQRMRTGEFDPTANQPYTRITKDVIESQAHRKLAQKMAAESLTLLQNERPGGAGAPLLPIDPTQVENVVVVGDQASKVFLGDYSGNPTEKVSLLDGIKRALPEGQVTYDSANSSSTATQPPSLQPATKTAIQAADLVVVMVGTDALTNAEGYDRKTLALPGNYRALVEQVAELGNPRVALVDQSAGPVDLRPVRGKVASILFSAANGQRQGLAAADALFGKVNPSGHLSFTWYAGDEQLPDKNDYDLTPAGTGGLGRTYQYFTGRPTYPFGYGLSFTRFRYRDVQVSRRRIEATGTERISFRVTNTGSRAGATVAQVYATPPGGVPTRKLVGFARTKVLAPGAGQRITIKIPLVPNLRAWDAKERRQAVRRGEWRFALARTASDPVKTFAVHITGRIPRRITTVTLQPTQVAIAPGKTIDLRGRNPWRRGLAPPRYDPIGDRIITAVRADDSFADLRAARVTFKSNRPAVATVTRVGKVKAIAPGVATITVTVDGASASAPIVVRSS
jgi:beta-glucosidase-like glycosyl hydrolase